MKLIIKLLSLIIVGSFMLFGIIKDLNKVKTESIINVDKKSVTYNGWLNTNDSKLLNSKKEIVTLKGISTHGIQWFNNLYTYDNIKYLKDEWDINVFRIAMYTSPSEDGYIKNKNLKEDVIKLIDYCIDLDIYVIVDWHILKDKNPKTYEKEAIEFFSELSLKYKDVPNVIYEICNEPNGDTKWIDVKTYSEEVIKAIRANSPKSLIIVGIPDWSKDLDSVSNNPLDIENIMYSLHFYSGTDNEILRKKMTRFLKKKLPIFVSECGITKSDGNGKIYEDEFNKWIKYLEDNDISWIFWNFSNKDETSAILKKEYKIDSSEEISIDDYLSDTGIKMKQIFKPTQNNTENIKNDELKSAE